MMEERYQSQWKAGMIADYCWCLKREDLSKHVRKLRKRALYLHCCSVNKCHFTYCISDGVIFQQSSFVFDFKRKKICSTSVQTLKFFE